MPPTESPRRRWMRQWRSAAVALEEVRRAELRRADLARVAADLEDACLASLETIPPEPTSGLVTQQRLFHRAPGR